jgi:hypothetical protein
VVRLAGLAKRPQIRRFVHGAVASHKYTSRQASVAAMTDPEKSTGARKQRTRKARTAASPVEDGAPGEASHGVAVGHAGAAAAEIELAEVAGPVAVAPAPARTVSDALFRDIIIEAAAAVGFDGEGSDGLKGYLRSVAGEDRKTYFGVLAKLILGEAVSGAGETVTRIERVIVRAPE